jgi:hypothetical protein
VSEFCSRDLNNDRSRIIIVVCNADMPSHKASPARNALFSHEDIFFSFKRSISLHPRLTFFLTQWELCLSVKKVSGFRPLLQKKHRETPSKCYA